MHHLSSIYVEPISLLRVDFIPIFPSRAFETTRVEGNARGRLSLIAIDLCTYVCNVNGTK